MIRPGSRNSLLFIGLLLLTVLLFAGMLFCGAVSIPASDVLGIIMGNEGEKASWRTIIIESRLPMAATAALAGAALSVAGLMLQTVFRNPLAGPSILGISSGASLGVGLVVLMAGAFPAIQPLAEGIGIIGGALLGAIGILVVLSIFSSLLHNPLSLLIIGVMVSYLASSLISLLNFLAPAESVQKFVVWGLGSYAGVDLTTLPILAVATVLSLGLTLFYMKPMNAMLLGDRYLMTMGYSVNTLRSTILGISGLLTAVITAYCGPIGFIGLVVPHIARMLFSTSNHFTLVPACVLTGASLSLLCALASVLPSSAGVIPINAITPIAGVPVIIYIMLNTKKIKYFN